jgi:hypothetical protein
MPGIPQLIKRTTTYPSHFSEGPAFVELDNEVGMALQDQVVGCVVDRYLVSGIFLKGVV